MPHSIRRVSEPTLTTRQPLRVCTGSFISCFVPSTVDMPGPADQNLLDMDSLLLAGGIDPDVDEAIAALAAAQSVSQLESASTCDAGFLRWATGLVDLIAGLDPSAAPKWCVARRAFLSMMTTSGGGGGRDCDPAALFDLIEWADMVDICGQGNRAAPFARDLVGRFYQKSVTPGSFFRDVRMTPSHFDEVVALSTPHLPRSSVPPPYPWPTVFLPSCFGWHRVGSSASSLARWTSQNLRLRCTAPPSSMRCSPGCQSRSDRAAPNGRKLPGTSLG